MNPILTAAANDNFGATLILDAHAFADERHIVAPPLVDAALAGFGINRRIVVGAAGWLDGLGRLPAGWTGIAANCNERLAVMASLKLLDEVRRSKRIFIATATDMVVTLAPMFAQHGTRVIALVDRAHVALRPLVRARVLTSTLFGMLDDVTLPLPPRLCAANDAA